MSFRLCSFVRLFVCSFVRLFVCSFVRLFVCGVYVIVFVVVSFVSDVVVVWCW